MTQSSLTLSKSLVDENRSRDIRRRVEVIHKKLADLQTLGIPCAFCYSSTRNTGSIFTLGDTRITNVIERYKNEIHRNLNEDPSDVPDGNFSKEIHLILPPIPAPLEELSRSSLQSLIIGILKDLGVRWSDPKPAWWPLDVPFVHPRCMPEDFGGNWISALRKVLESVYSYFSYDINTYISNQLTSPKPDPSGENIGQPLTVSLSKQEHPPQDQMSSDSDEDSPMESSCRENSKNEICKTSSNNAHKVVSNKLLSNFTVENILMGPQHNSSTSSNSPSRSGSSSVSPTPPAVDYTSVMGANWVSHPPVKYTKFTMLSPVSMGEETQKKKRTKPEPPPNSSLIQSTPFRRHSSSNDLPTKAASEKDVMGMRRVPSNPTFPLVPTHKTHHPSQALYSNPHPTVSTGAPVSVSSVPQSKHNRFSTQVLQTKSVSTLPIIQAVPFPSTAVKANLQQTFPPSQQFVLLVPSTSTRISEGLQAVVYSSPTQVIPVDGNSKPLSQTLRVANSSKRNHISKHESDATSVQKPSDVANSDLERLPVEVNYRPIAPKTESIVHESVSTSTNEKKKKRSISKPQKLRFHMTTVVKRPKGTVMTSSMTVESPSPVVNTRIKSTSYVLNTQSDDVRCETNMKAKNAYPNNNRQCEDEETRVVESKRSTVAEVTVESHDKFVKSSHSSTLKNTSVHNQASRNEDSAENHSVSHFNDDKLSSLEGVRDNGKTTRNYTRRKRELTFHRYEDPETAFKVKRALKE